MLNARSLSRIGRLSLFAAACAVLASCGGSGGGDNGNGNGGGTPTPPPATNQPPASASQDAAGFIAYLKVLVATQPNNIEPLDVTTFVAPTSTGEPDPSV